MFFSHGFKDMDRPNLHFDELYTILRRLNKVSALMPHIRRRSGGGWLRSRLNQTYYYSGGLLLFYKKYLVDLCDQDFYEHF